MYSFSNKCYSRFDFKLFLTERSEKIEIKTTHSRDLSENHFIKCVCIGEGQRAYLAITLLRNDCWGYHLLLNSLLKFMYCIL